MYKINQYIIFTLPNQDVVMQNSNSITIIKDLTLKLILNKWDKHNIKRVSYEDLKDQFGENTDEAIEFLITYSILDYEHPKTIDVDKITIISNNLLAQELHSNLNNDYPDLQIKLYDINNYGDVEKNELTLVFLSPYNKKIADKILGRQRKENTSKIMFTYIYNGNFYIDCLYSPEWKTPCHNCHMGHIESSGLVQDDEYSMTYQNMINLIYKEDEDFLVEIPLTAIQKVNIMSVILNNLRTYINDFSSTNLHQENVTDCILIDLNTMKKYKDTSIYWELCDCYE